MIQNKIAKLEKYSHNVNNQPIHINNAFTSLWKNTSKMNDEAYNERLNKKHNSLQVLFRSHLVLNQTLKDTRKRSTVNIHLESSDNL